MSACTSRVALCAFVGVVFASSSARAEPQTSGSTLERIVERPRGDDERTIHGHAFPRTVTDESALLSSTVGFRQGLLFIDGGAVKFFGRNSPLLQVAAIESLDATVNVREWFAVSARSNVQVLLGGSEASLYSTPSYLSAGGRIGPIFRLFRIPSTGTQVSVRGFYEGSTGANVDVSHVVPTLRDRFETELDSPIRSPAAAISRLRELEGALLRASVSPLGRRAWGASLHVANAITPQLGVQVSYGLKRERLVRSTYDINLGNLPDEYYLSVSHLATAALSFDPSRWGLPIAALLEVAVTGGSIGPQYEPGSVAYATSVHTGAGLYYAGRRSLQLGVHAAAEFGLTPYETPFGKSSSPTAYYGEFAIRYFFSEAN